MTKFITILFVFILFSLEAVCQKVRIDKNDKAYIEGSVQINNEIEDVYLTTWNFFNDSYENIEFNIIESDDYKETLNTICTLEINNPNNNFTLNFNLFTKVNSRLLYYKITNIRITFSNETIINIENYILNKNNQKNKNILLNSIYREVSKLLDKINKE